MIVKKYDLSQKVVWLENVKIMQGSYKNFSGRKNEYNRVGWRTFCIILDDLDFANQLKEDGWNVKIRAPREDGDEPIYYLQLKLSFNTDESNINGMNFQNPIVKRISGGTILELTPETCGQLDDDDVEYIDVRIRPSHWEVRGDVGYTGYVKELYATVSESLADKYVGMNY
jgi:hypothetical protein